jgi:hypothetical protein
MFFSRVSPEAGSLFATVVAMTSVSSRFTRSTSMSLSRPKSENVLPLRWPTCMASSTCISARHPVERPWTHTSSAWTTARLSTSARSINRDPNPLTPVMPIARHMGFSSTGQPTLFCDRSGRHHPFVSLTSRQNLTAWKSMAKPKRASAPVFRTLLCGLGYYRVLSKHFLQEGKTWPTT